MTDYICAKPDCECYGGVCNATIAMPARIAELEAINKELVEALGLATKELNGIRARDGAPQHIDWDRGQPIQTDACSKEWWNELTEKCWDVLDRAAKLSSE